MSRFLRNFNPFANRRESSPSSMTSQSHRNPLPNAWTSSSDPSISSDSSDRSKTLGGEDGERYRRGRPPFDDPAKAGGKSSSPPILGGILDSANPGDLPNSHKADDMSGLERGGGINSTFGISLPSNDSRPAKTLETRRSRQYPTQRSSIQRHESYDFCRTSVTRVITGGDKSKLVDLRDNDAQCVADFISEVLDTEDSLSQTERKHLLHLLTKLAKSAQVFPQRLELKNVKCDLLRHVTQGGFGLIYKGEHENRSICVKTAHVTESGIDRRKMRAHAGELIMWAHLSHQNVLPFSGIFLSEERVPRVCIVSPWMENGDLRQYLKNFPDAHPVPLVHDIISGLKYLHDFEIVHADLKAKNILVSEANRAMVADFGISRIMVTSITTTTQVVNGTAHWMAPELLLSDEPIPADRASDIWAFACTCYEIITGMAPFYQFRTDVQVIGAFYRGTFVPLKPKDGWNEIKETIWLIAERCWKDKPQNRPTSEELQKVLTDLNTADYRLPEPLYHRTKTDTQVNYPRVLDVLNQVQNSQGGTRSANQREVSRGNERRREEPVTRVQVQAPESRARLSEESARRPGPHAVKGTDKKFTVMVTTGGEFGQSGPFSKFFLVCAFENPQTKIEEVWTLNVNSDVAVTGFQSIGADRVPPERRLVGVYQSQDQFVGFDRISGSIGHGKIYIRTQRGLVVKGDIVGGPNNGQTFVGAGTWTKA